MESLERYINDQRRQKNMNARFSEDSDNEERQNSQNSKKSEIRELAREIKTMASGNRRSGKTKPPTFKQGSNPRLFLLRFDDWVRLEQDTDERAALAFKNAVADEVALLGLTRLPQDIQTSYVKLKQQFLKTYDTNADQFYKTTRTEVLKQKSDESVMEYYRKLYINSSPQKDQKSLIFDFVKGLLPEFKLHILGNAKGPEDLSVLNEL